MLIPAVGEVAVTHQSEMDLALANIGLDLLGQARNLSYAAELAGEGDEIATAFTEDERQFSNLLFVEQPNGNFADTVTPVFHRCMALSRTLYPSQWKTVIRNWQRFIAKAIKEARYHLRFSTWLAGATRQWY